MFDEEILRLLRIPLIIVLTVALFLLGKVVIKTFKLHCSDKYLAGFLIILYIMYYMISSIF